MRRGTLESGFFAAEGLTCGGCRKLGSVVDEDDDYVLRVITANIIRELCTGISHRADFWPPKVDGKPDGHKDFPLAPAPHSLWVQSLADYLSKKSLSRGFQGDR